MKPRDTGKNTGTKASVKVLKILVVEDHADMRTGLGVLFKLLGHRARFASDVATARTAFREERFDVLLSDINLPDGTGWELLREVRELERHPPTAIAMSGFCSDKDICSSREAGFDLHLVKPFPPEELTSALQRAAEALPEKESRVSSTPRKRKVAHVHSDGRPGPYIYPCL